jgi:hypothetical protein
VRSSASVSLDDLDELVGYVAAEANHGRDRRRMRLDAREC